jgi:hypothetical protein
MGFSKKLIGLVIPAVVFAGCATAEDPTTTDGNGSGITTSTVDDVTTTTQLDTTTTGDDTTTTGDDTTTTAEDTTTTGDETTTTAAN